MKSTILLLIFGQFIFQCNGKFLKRIGLFDILIGTELYRFSLPCVLVKPLEVVRAL